MVRCPKVNYVYEALLPDWAHIRSPSNYRVFR